MNLYAKVSIILSIKILKTIFCVKVDYKYLFHSHINLMNGYSLVLPEKMTILLQERN